MIKINEWALARTTRKDECPGCGIVPAFLPAVEHLPGCPTRPIGRTGAVTDAEK